MGRRKQIEIPINLTIRINKPVARAVQELARRRQVSAGVILREAVTHYMNLRRQQKDLES